MTDGKMFFSLSMIEYEGLLGLVAFGHFAAIADAMTGAEQSKARRLLREQVAVVNELWKPLGANGSDRLLTRLHAAAVEQWGDSLHVSVARVPTTEGQPGATRL